MRRPAVLAPLTVVVLMGSACSGASPSPSEMSSAPERTDDVGGDISWLSVRPVEDDDITTAVDFDFVRADGSVARSETVALDPQVPGGLLLAPPRGGVMAIGTGTGGGVELRAIHASDGAAVDLGAFTEQAVGAAVEPSGANVYVFLAGSEERILRLPADGGEPEEILRRPANGRLILTWDRLAISPNGRWLIVDSCIADGCVWEVIDLETGDVRLLRPDGAGSRVDVSNDTLLAPSADCAVGPCPFLLIGLTDGRVEPWDPEAHNARLATHADGRTLLLHDRWGTEGSDGVITITDPETGDTSEVTAEDATGQPLGLARQGQDTWVPDGWELLAPPGINVGEAGGPTLLRLADGTVHRLPQAVQE